MNFSTFNLSDLLKKAGLAIVVLGTAVSAQAAAVTFVHEGIIYKSDAKQTKLTAQYPDLNGKTKLTDGGEAPKMYSGDVVIPSEITYNGVTMPVTSIQDAFYETEITSIYVPDGVALKRGAFAKCYNLKSARVPADYNFKLGDEFQFCYALEEITIPAGAVEVSSGTFKDCYSLRKITIDDAATPLELSATAFVIGADLPESQLQEVVINRAIGSKYTAMDSKPFRNKASIKKVVIGGSCVALPASYFAGCTGLESVTFENEFNSLGTNLFEGTALPEVTLPASVTSISSSCFQGCKSLKKVVLGSDVTSIGEMAFMNSGVNEINLPASLKTIGQMAFSGSKLAGELTLPEAVTSVGIQSFAGTGLTAVNFPSSVRTIGIGAFMNCNDLAKVSVAAENENFASNAASQYITNKAGDNLVLLAPASDLASLEGAFTAVSAYACYGAKNLKAVNLPSCVNFGDYSFYGSGIKSFKAVGEVGRYVAANCLSLEDLTVDAGASVPMGIADGCVALAKVTLRQRTATVKQDAFKGCAALKSLDLGKTLSILETDCFAGSGIETLVVCATTPAAMSEGVFTASSNINVVVPVDLVEAYKAADGWKLLNISGDANLAEGPSDMGMPDGLYYAGEDGMLHCVYADGQTDTYDVGGVPHTFQLLEYADRIYGACAGKKFVYSATGATDGDGKLFYISKIGGDVFQATVLDNTEGNAYADPFGLYEYNGILYVNDRNVSLRKIPASAIALPKNFPSWVTNNDLAYYGPNWAYGCIKAGFNITSDPADGENIYWVGMKYNGNGIFTFKDVDIKSDKLPESGAFLTNLNPILTTFQIDKKNGHMYIYLEKAGTGSDDDLSSYVKGGLYRVNLEDLYANPTPASFNVLKPVLIDGSPVKYEGSGTNEHVGITQLAIDSEGEYLYWCYRAPTASEASANEAQDYATMSGGKYWWAEAYNEANPLHHSGIKRIKLGEAKPEVEMVVEGVAGYGVAPVNYEGSKRPSAVKTIAVEGLNKVLVSRDAINVDADAKVVVYSLNGTIVAYVNLAAGQSYSIADLPAGAYVVTATFANGQTSVAKAVK